MANQESFQVPKDLKSEEKQKDYIIEDATKARNNPDQQQREILANNISTRISTFPTLNKGLRQALENVLPRTFALRKSSSLEQTFINETFLVPNKPEVNVNGIKEAVKSGNSLGITILLDATKNYHGELQRQLNGQP